MLPRGKIHFFRCIIFATFVLHFVLSVSAQKPFNAVHEIMPNITRAISEAIDELGKKMEEKFRDKFNKIDQFEDEFNAKFERIENQLNASSNSVCHTNDPCLYGSRCRPTSTGNGYVCVDCPKFRSGIHCENVECAVEKRCWRLNDTLYVVIETNLTWAEAKVKCESQNMTLAMPKDEEKTQFLYDQLKPVYYPYSYDLWLGLKREARGWFWLDGSAVGEYTGGWDDMKSETGSKFGQLDFSVASRMWIYGETTERTYSVCETLFISH